MAETLLLDPTSEDAANAQLDITGTGYGLIEHHYPQPPVAAQWASSADTEGSRLGSVKHENRQIQITLDVDGLTALRALQAKLGKLHREGGTFKRTLSDATVIVFDVLTVEGYDPEFSYTFDMATVTQVSFTLTCLPYGRGPEVTLSSHSETTLPVLVFTETGIKGDMPGLGRLVITDASATTQSFALWGIQSRYYDAASTAALFYQAESCTLLSGTLAAGAAGASGAGSNIVRHANLHNPADPNYTTDGYIGLHYIGTATQTHVGTFRVIARVYAPAANAGAVSVRCAWKPYVGAPTISNTPAVASDNASAPIEAVYMLMDLGIVQIPKATKGSQGWSGRIEASGVVGDDIDVDWVMLIPADEGSGQARSTQGVVVASRTMEISDSGVLTNDSSTFYRRPIYEGDYLRVPPAGAEARTLRVVVKLSRATRIMSPGVSASAASFNDAGIDDLSGQLFYRPRYLVVPSA